MISIFRGTLWTSFGWRPTKWCNFSTLTNEDISSILVNYLRNRLDGLRTKVQKKTYTSKPRRNFGIKKKKIDRKRIKKTKQNQFIIQINDDKSIFCKSISFMLKIRVLQNRDGFTWKKRTTRKELHWKSGK